MGHTATAPGPPGAPIELTEDGQDWLLLMGPVEGDVPGLVRRIRRILDVSQRGLAEVLGVSQSMVARWETARTSPRANVLQQLLRLAGIGVALRDEWTGEPVEPMREDGARTRGGSRYPAHVDLRVTGWWVPRALRTMTSVEYARSRDLSRRFGVPSVRYRVARWMRAIERRHHGTPADHPSFRQLVAEAEHLEEERQARRERALRARRLAA
ncbi:helix-turn-helix domain-containing protein [Nocardioides sp. zg-1228]|uniref:helix-turn-helix domain-containing protein n=1 Tax=Nocardioides sp. zg-1228 TaxID=2763008 RepID=UPI001643251C|nr:helix-turn-helix transcriptional regulator [Nocardioides sp. zg-1228]MBC2934497.1 helix-turn-helix transcriptional regulator [Nocardioides sp. zg-1228]QSF59257.1 helix-turn-helix transcriptional regulator [Nocardioides sp. zg-1228]